MSPVPNYPTGSTMPYPARLFVSAYMACALLTSGCTPRNQRQAPTASPEALNAPGVLQFENRLVDNTHDPIALQTGRYTYIAAVPTPEQVNPLLVVIDVHLPMGVDTVSDAAEYLLVRSGYHLADYPSHSAKARGLFEKHIPDVQRHLGPMTLRDALLTLGGPAFRLLVDPVNRLVAYGVSPKFELPIQRVVTR